MKAKTIFKKNNISSLLSIFFAAFVSTFLAYAVFTNDDIKTIEGESAQKERLVLSDYAAGEVLVKFKKGVDTLTVDSIADSLYFDVEKYFRAVSRVKGQVYVHMKSEFLTTRQMQAQLAGRWEVEDVSPNYRLYADNTFPNDPRFNELWGLHNTGQTGGTVDVDIDAPEAWDTTTGSPGVIAAVIDTGIDYNHPDLAANIWVNPNEIQDGVDNDGNGYVDDIHGINAITGSGDPMDDNGHGTHCSGTIGAVGNNGMGVVGVNWNVKLMGTKFLNASGSGYSSDAITCIDYIIDQKTSYGQNIVAINASYGGGGYSQSVKDAIDAAGAAGIVFCAAAGNSGTNNDSSPHYPSSYTCSNIIAVTAVDHSGYQYYNYGAVSVDLGAPGRSILSTVQCVYTPQPGDIFFDDMGSGTSQWTHGGILDSWAITNAAAGGLESYWWDMSYGYFWSDSPGTGYVHNVDNWLAAADDIDLSSYAGQTVYLGFDGGFQMDYFASNDTAAVEISNDSGNNWTTLADLTTLYNGYGYYYKKQFYVIPGAYKTANFRFRFHITSDDTDYSYYGYKNKGWIIDNIGIGTDGTCGYGTKNGTSMATPHVTGAVAFIAAYYPSETAAERIARILDNVVPLPSLSGKCVTGGLLNLDAAVSGVTSTITVITPNGGEYWEIDSSQSITWSSTGGTIEDVKIEYSIDNGTSWTEIIAATPNDGSYDWTVPDNPSDNCLIRVSDTDGNPSDVSDAVFSITGPFITLTSPNGGQEWGVGDSHPITWTSAGVGENVKLDYSVNNGSRWIEIVSSTPNDGSYDWQIPDNPSETCRVRVSEIGGPLSDQSDNVFTITIFPTITVTSPNGGENLESGSFHNITWTSTGSVGNVKIEYSTPGRPWMEIAAATANDGKYKWTVPETASDNCTVRVSEIDGTPWDVSDAVFTIFIPPSLTVTSPNGGEYWEIGSQQSITWTGRGTGGYIGISYSIDNGSSWKYIITTADDGEYNWTVPDDPSGNCLIRVREIDGDPWDVSDAAFTIYQGEALTVTSPNGGENWQAGTSHNITWTSTGAISDVKIEYSTNNGSSWTDVAVSTANDGSYNWTVPDTPSSNCLVRISDVLDGNPADVGNTVFAIYSQPAITVTSPNGGEVLESDSSHQITWTTTETVGDVKIECSFNNGSVWRAIVTSTANDGSYNWTVPDTPSANCLVRVSEADGSPTDVSNAVFAIVLPPSITVTSPNGGENWQVGTAHHITWKSTGPVGNVKIEYSTDNGQSWTEIAASTANDGSHPWTIPETPSESCRVRVSESSGEVSDVSNAVFAIAAEQQNTITVTSPNGGEVLETGFSHDITWTTSGTVGNLVIRYSTNSGNTWTTLAASTENDGSYNWTIPDEPSNNCLVRIAENNGDDPSDTSDAVFSIISASLTVTSPNGGESLTMGTGHEITWTGTGTIGNISIDYSIDSGTSWTVIVESTENDGSYNWTVPDEPSDNCLVRIRENDDDTGPLDTSNETFSIIPRSTPVITITYPNGGETLFAGAVQEITWTGSGTIDHVAIEYSIDNGAGWSEIIASTANGGSFAWTVPESPSETCLIRISDTDGGPSDVSDAVFSIALPSAVTVTSPNGGEALYAGAIHEITWTTTGTVGNVTLEYSINSGNSWTNIAAAAENNGTYNWTVPGPSSDHCLVRIRENENEGDTSPWDVSDAEFSIDASSYTSVTVTSPNGGEILYEGSAFEITWSSTGIIDDVKIEYSIDNGSSWQEIAASTANDGSYTWAVPGTPSMDCRVRVGETTGNPSPVSDESDAVFEISPGPEPTITVTSPNGGETLTAGAVHEITWTSTGSIDNVIIEYSIDNGSTWETVEISAVNNGSYNWIVPGAPSDISDSCLVRISRADADLDPSDVSDGVFSIADPTFSSITVTSPNGGENLPVDSIHEITWTSTGEIGTVMIEYSVDNGVSWIEIAASTPNEGSYQWTVPDNPSDECLVRIRGTDGDEAPWDVSNAVFSIVSETLTCGFQGCAYEIKPDGSWDPIEGVEITFVSEDGNVTRGVITDRNGFYRISLSPQRYVVTAVHPDFHPYSSAPGFFVVTGNGYQTGNFFLTRK